MKLILILFLLNFQVVYIVIIPSVYASAPNAPSTAMIIVVFVIIILLLLVGAYRTRAGANKIILEKKKEYETMRSNFFTNISHEFRTPLTLIKGPLLRLSQFHELDKESIEMALRNTERLERLITQLLDLSKLESGGIPVITQTLDLPAYFRVISSPFALKATEKKIHLELHLPPGPIFAQIDPDKTEKIIHNLLSNALKFTPENGIVQFAAHIAESTYTLEISDSGNGIPEEDIPHLFDRFFRSWAENNSNFEGSGIGLALTKELVELLSGTIEVTSKRNEGTIFRVVLPLVIYPDKETAEWTDPVEFPDPLNQTEDTATPFRPTLLIVEDHPDMRRYIKTCLGEDFQVLEAAQGTKGLEICSQILPDLIISDLMMPGMDGLTFCKKIRSNLHTSHIPFIMLTAKADDESKIQGLQLGADDYLIKPFLPEELLLKIRNSLNRQKLLQEKLRAQVLAQPIPLETLSTDELFLLHLRETIEKNLSEPNLTVASLSREVALSRVQLYRKVQALTGISVSELIRSIRVKKAANLFDQKWGNVSQVAYEVGFNNLSYFAKCFKDQFNRTPSEYLAEKDGPHL